MRYLCFLGSVFGAAPHWDELCHLTVLNEDALLSGTLSFEITKAPARLEIGRKDSEANPGVALSGSGICARHCYCEQREDGTAFLVVVDGGNSTFVNGQRLEAKAEVQLNSGDRIVVGQNYVFLVVLPSVGVSREELLRNYTYESAMTELAMEQGGLQSTAKTQQQLEEETFHRTQYANKLKEAEGAMEKQKQASPGDFPSFLPPTTQSCGVCMGVELLLLPTGLLLKHCNNKFLAISSIY